MNLLIHFLLIQPISHSQFETIHAYRDGNGRLGRALIPIQLAKLTDDRPILFLSEVIELYKPSYHKFLNESRKTSADSRQIDTKQEKRRRKTEMKAEKGICQALLNFSYNVLLNNVIIIFLK